MTFKSLDAYKTRIMKLYKREDFIKLQSNTVYSKIHKYPIDELCYGLFCKISGNEYKSDWVEQDLISEGGFPNDITDGYDAVQYQLNLRDNFKDFETDLNCGGRDGMFDDDDLFVVWDRNDILKLNHYLTNILNQTL